MPAALQVAINVLANVLAKSPYRYRLCDTYHTSTASEVSELRVTDRQYDRSPVVPVLTYISVLPWQGNR